MCSIPMKTYTFLWSHWLRVDSGRVVQALVCRWDPILSISYECVSRVFRGASEKGCPQSCSVTDLLLWFCQRTVWLNYVTGEYRARYRMKVISWLLSFSPPLPITTKKSNCFVQFEKKEFLYDCVQFTIHRLLSKASETSIDPPRCRII